MTTKELNEKLREEGRFLGMCDEFYLTWREYSESELVKLMFHGIDFCLKHHWPSNEFIRKNFSKDFLRGHAVFIDDTYSISNAGESLVLGNSEIRYRYSGKYYSNIRVRDNSSVCVTARGTGLVIIHLFDKSSVRVEQSEKARVAVIKHSKDTSAEATQGVRIVEEYDYLD